MIGLETIGAALEMAVFGLLAIVTLFFAIFVVAAKDVVRAGLALILCMFGVAALLYTLKRPVSGNYSGAGLHRSNRSADPLCSYAYKA